MSIIEMSDSLKATIMTYAYMCRNGKPTAVVSVQNRYIEQSIEIIKLYKLKYHTRKLADGWQELWMYNNCAMKTIIECTPNTPISKYDHWVLGKLFGYSDEKIFSFIETHGE